MFGDERDRLRDFYARCLTRARAGEPLTALEQLVAGVLHEHPEYHAVVLDPGMRGGDFPLADGDANPFLHLGMHVALREQAVADRPAGFRTLHAQLGAVLGGQHAAEHRMMACLGEVMWAAQRDGRPPDETAFLDCVRALAPLARR